MAPGYQSQGSVRALGPASSITDHLGRIAEHPRPGGNILRHQRAGLDERARADAYALQDGRVGSYPHVVVDEHRPPGEHAMASWTRASGSTGWKSVSAMVTFQPMTTLLPMRTSNSASRTALV